MDQYKLKTYNAPQGVPISPDYVVQVRPVGTAAPWSTTPAYAINASSANITSDTFHNHVIAVASIDIHGPVEVKARYSGTIETAALRPASYDIESTVEGSTVVFILDRPRDVMLEVNGNKWTALHLLVNEIDISEKSDNVWYFGPGIDQGAACSRVVDGTLAVPSGTTVYLAGGAFLTAKVVFRNVSNSAIRGHGFIYKPDGGAILIEGSNGIVVDGVTSLSASGFSLTTGESKDVHINRYRSFSSHGNGDGIDVFCSSDMLIENCFLRNSDDTIALYSHRWSYYGDSRNIAIRNCVLLPDIAHPINIGTHGNPARPETISDVTIRNIDILDHEEHQLWYQGCIAINSGDANLIENVLVENVRVERITKGQLVNLRVMQNGMWTTAPGRGIRNVMFRNVHLQDWKTMNPSQIMGYDERRKVENVSFEDLKIGERFIHDGMAKPRWYTTADFVPLFSNEHVSGLSFKLNK